MRTLLDLILNLRHRRIIAAVNLKRLEFDIVNLRCENTSLKNELTALRKFNDAHLTPPPIPIRSLCDELKSW